MLNIGLQELKPTSNLVAFQAPRCTEHERTEYYYSHWMSYWSIAPVIPNISSAFLSFQFSLIYTCKEETELYNLEWAKI